MNYEKKYLKYKNKYLELKNNIQRGGANMLSVRSIKNALENIELNSYEIFQINLTESNKNMIESIKINKTEKYDFFGNVDDLICAESDDLKRLIDYICTIGKNTEELAKEFIDIIKNIVETLSLGYRKKYCWLTIRSSLPNSDYEITRFHCDGKYFSGVQETQTKFIFVLKGAGTILIEPDEQVKQVYWDYLTQSTDTSKPLVDINSIEERKLLDEKLKDANAKQLQINNEHGLIFLAGCHSNCTIHSEPNITEPRMFLSIVFGDESNINKLKNRNGKK